MTEIRIGDDVLTMSWEDFEERVREGRVPPDALVRFPPITGDLWRHAAELDVYHELRKDRTAGWRLRFESNPVPWMTALIVGIQIRLWWWARLPDVRSELLRDWTRSTSAILEQGEAWRLISMGFLQVDWLHLALNMVWLAATARNLERAIGRSSVLLVFVASVVGGAFCSTLATPEAASLGASGGVFGLIAASVAFEMMRPELERTLSGRAIGLVLLPYLVVMWIIGLTSPATDNWSHTGGAVVGGLLGMLLDPAGAERRSGWNRRVRRLGWLAIAGTLAVASVYGPQLAPIQDAHQLEATDRRVPFRRVAEGDIPIGWKAPAGWRLGHGPDGDLAFHSPIGERMYSVTLRRLDQPRALEDVLDDWVDRAARRGYEVGFGPIRPESLAGHPGYTATGEQAGDGGPLTLQWRGAVRGVWVVEEVWRVEPGLAERLEPLRERLHRAIVWNDPANLVAARSARTLHPNDPQIKLRLAEAWIEVGEQRRAHELLMDLAFFHPSPAVSRQLLRLARWYPEEVEKLDPLIDTALSYANTDLLLDVVATLESRGRDHEARGLLEARWHDEPGDRALSSARIRRGMPVGLDQAGRPLQRPPAELLAQDGPSAWAALGDWSDRRADALAMELVLAEPDERLGLVRPLTELRFGGIPADLQEAVLTLRLDLNFENPMADDRWLPPDLDVRVRTRLSQAIASLSDDEIKAELRRHRR